jgi:hypothetical protein
MNSVLKTALLVGVAIAVETLMLRRLFIDLSWGIFLGVFLVASVLLVALQHVASKRHSMRSARQRQRRVRQEPSPAIWSGLDPSSVPTTHNESNHNSAPRREQMAESALPDEDGIINKERS